MTTGKETRLATESDGPVIHAPVLVEETLTALGVRSGGVYMDGTVGLGGHAGAILEESGPGGLLVGLDWDGEALALAQERLKRFGNRLILRRRSYGDAREVMEELGWKAVDGIVLDLGVSYLQLSKAERGFSFLHDGPLDMRMDTRKEETAATLLKRLTASEMAQIFWDFGEEPESRRIARTIVEERSRTPLSSTAELARLVERVVRRRRRIHPATRVFQALRIAVNGELDELKRFLAGAHALLRPGGVLAIVSFHSLEDRIVKREFQKWEKDCLCPPGVPVCACGWSRKAKSLFRKPVTPSREEIRRNPRARSAHLRAVRRVECEV